MGVNLRSQEGKSVDYVKAIKKWVLPTCSFKMIRHSPQTTIVFLKIIDISVVKLYLNVSSF